MIIYNGDISPAERAGVDLIQVPTSSRPILARLDDGELQPICERCGKELSHRTIGNECAAGIMIGSIDVCYLCDECD